MDPQQVAASYDRLAPHWAGPAFDRSDGIAQHERALLFTKGLGRALDVGCGSSGRIIELLLRRGFVAEGLDISTEMLRLARSRHPGVLFHSSDIAYWEPPIRYPFISAWDSIWHVSLSLQRCVLTKLCNALSPGGVFIFTTGGVENPGETTNPCLGQPMYHAAVGISGVLRTVSEAGCVCRHLEYDHYPEPHVYLIVQRT